MLHTASLISIVWPRLGSHSSSKNLKRQSSSIISTLIFLLFGNAIVSLNGSNAEDLSGSNLDKGNSVTLNPDFPCSDVGHLICRLTSIVTTSSASPAFARITDVSVFRISRNRVSYLSKTPKLPSSRRPTLRSLVRRSLRF